MTTNNDFPYRRGGKLHFISRPPLKGVRPSKRKDVNKPYPEAEPYKCSVYYYWWEYLRRNEGYMSCCKRGGRGAFSKLYADFGDLRSDDFWKWWKDRGQFLFCEPRSIPLRQITKDKIGEVSEHEVIISIPLTQSISYTIGKLRKILGPLLKDKRVGRQNSRALYKVGAKPSLTALHQHLKIWDLHLVNPDCPYHELADLAGIIVATGYSGSVKQEMKNDREIKHLKTMAVSRHLRLAKSCIEKAATHKFP
jgi:hypothetical protein